MKRIITAFASLVFAVPVLAQGPHYLGRLSANPYSADSTSNSFGLYGSPYALDSINNPYGPYGSPYSMLSTENPFTVSAPRLFAPDGTYLGRLSANQFDPESVSNPYGLYGSPYSATSINNPYSLYGSPYSTMSPNNPYSTEGPLIFSSEGDFGALVGDPW